MTELSNHLKAVLVLDDLNNNDSLNHASRNDCLTLKKFHYRCSRGHDAFRVTGSMTGSSILSFELKLNTESNIRIFYECMHKNMPQPFTIVFNASFNDQSQIEDYQDAMTVYGYVIAVNDVYNSGVMQGEGRGKVDIKVDVLISSITYVGKDENLVLSISRKGNGR